MGTCKASNAENVDATSGICGSCIGKNRKKDRRTKLTIKISIIVLSISLIGTNFHSSFASNITYQVLDNRIKGMPTVCTIEPNDTMISETKSKDIMMGTKSGVLEWKYMLQAQARKPIVWDMKYVEIPKENRESYDYTKCDVIIDFKRQIEGDIPQGYGHILGQQQYVPELDASYIEIFYQQFGICERRDQYYVYHYGCYKDDIITTPALALTVRHEFGHALGLGHYVSDNPTLNHLWGSTITEAPSIMVVYDSQVNDFKKIQLIDIQKVVEIYGDGGFGQPIIEKPTQEPKINTNDFPVTEVVVSRGKSSIGKLSNVISSYQKGQAVEITIIMPDKTKQYAKVIAGSNGYFEYPFSFNYKSARGYYYVTISYKGQEIAKQAYLVVDKKTETDSKSTKTSEKTTPKNSNSYQKCAKYKDDSAKYNSCKKFVDKQEKKKY